MADRPLASISQVSQLYVLSFLSFPFLDSFVCIKGASTGAGLGNSFLSHVRSVDGIFQVVRAFDDAEVIHVEGDVDPLRDMEIIRTELRLKDTEWVEKALENLKKTGRALGSNSLAEKARKEEIATTERILHTLKEEKRDVRKAEWNNKEVRISSISTLSTALNMY